MFALKLSVLVFAIATFAPSALSFNPPDIPLNWTTAFACAVDVGSRIIANDVTVQDSNNTPASCIERCDAQNSIYAGVEFSNECHCGTGLKGTPQAAPTSDCNMACTGDADLSCGGSFRIQVYKSPALPLGASNLQGCFVDTPATPAFGAPVVHHTFATNLELVTQCIEFCGHIGYTFAGVEAGEDCQCSFGLAPGALVTDESECNSLCPLPPGDGQEFCGGVERLMVYRYQG
ncbi:WSC-domain-containing protein [Lenzites betulinus]|nr:WSC-domain-containing protein [Lenzites betulinus]